MEILIVLLIVGGLLYYFSDAESGSKPDEAPKKRHYRAPTRSESSNDWGGDPSSMHEPGDFHPEDDGNYPRVWGGSGWDDNPNEPDID